MTIVERGILFWSLQEGFKDIITYVSVRNDGQTIRDYAISVASTLEVRITGIAMAFALNTSAASMEKRRPAPGLETSGNAQNSLIRYKKVSVVTAMMNGQCQLVARHLEQTKRSAD
jgi:hypothetical protein